VFGHVPREFQRPLLTMQTATTFFYLGQTNEAKARLEELLGKKPDDALLHSLRAVLFAASDAPVLQALHVYREQAYENNGGHQLVTGTVEGSPSPSPQPSPRGRGSYL